MPKPTLIISASALLRKVEEIHAAASSDLRQGAVEAGAEMGREVTCKDGCSYCCHQKVLTTAAEGMAIYMYLLKSGQWGPAMEAKLTEYDKAMTDRDHHAWFVEKRPCPFLDWQQYGKGTCTVYSVRPIACASSFATSGNPENCSIPGELPNRMGTFQVVGQTENLGRYFSIMASIRDYVDPGEDMILMTLPGSVLWAAAHAENRPSPDVKRLVYSGNITEKFDEWATIKYEAEKVAQDTIERFDEGTTIKGSDDEH